eukprot:XP_011607116.1 PREDICTED: ubiquitin carboxyl-terminal hydrolase 2-like [Takifugu rubripes]
MSRLSSTAKRYAGSSYSGHYGSYSSSLTPGLGSYGERDRLSSYVSPMSSTSSSGYCSSNYLSSSTARSRNYSTLSDPDRDRGRTVPRTDILGSSSSRRSESLSRTPVKSCRESGLSGGASYACYSSYPSSSAPSSYLSSSPAASGISLSRRRSVSQSDLSRDLASLGLGDASSSSSPSSSALRSYRSRTSDVSTSYGNTSRPAYSGLSRSSTLETFGGSSRSYSASAWEPGSTGGPASPSRALTLFSPLMECVRRTRELHPHTPGPALGPGHWVRTWDQPWSGPRNRRCEEWDNHQLFYVYV